MSDDIRCDDHVGEPFPPRCSACDFERVIAATGVPDYPPRVIDLAKAEAEGEAMAARWTEREHPVEVAAIVRALLIRSDPFWGTLVTRIALGEFLRWLTYECPLALQEKRSRLILPAVRILREIAPIDETPIPNTPRSHP